MKYINAETVLPKNLVEEIQKYVEGGYIYIPNHNPKKSWGEKSGIRIALQERNVEINNKFRQGCSIAQLAAMYYLSESSIRKIIKKLDCIECENKQCRTVVS